MEQQLSLDEQQVVVEDADFTSVDALLDGLEQALENFERVPSYVSRLQDGREQL